MCLQQCSPADASLQCMAVPQHSCTQMGRRRWPPPGGVQSAAHRRCAGRARPQSHRLQPKLQIYQQMAKFLMACSSSCFEGSYTPLFFSPQEPGDHRRPCAKKRKNGTLWLFFFRFFALPSCNLNFASKKHRKKCENQRFWPPKTLPKPSPKPFQMDVPKNIWFLRSFLTEPRKTRSLETLKISIFPKENQ